MIKAKGIINRLVDNLKEEGLTVTTNEEYGKNTLIISQNNIEKLRLYVKVSTIENPFWGLTKNRIDKLQSGRGTCDFKVILISNDCSITLSSSEVIKLLSTKNVANDGDYKITVNDLIPIWNIEKSLNKLYNQDNKHKRHEDELRVDVDTKISMVFDTKTNSLNSILFTPIKISNNTDDSKDFIIHMITETQKKFGILTLGAKNTVGASLPPQEEITLMYNGVIYSNKPVITHKTVKGRIDGLTDFYANNPDLTEGKEVKVTYCSVDKVLEIESDL